MERTFSGINGNERQNSGITWNEPTTVRRRTGNGHRYKYLDGPLTVADLLLTALPDKADKIDGWVATLADDSISIETLEDIRRFDMEDIAGLPVPPLVKSVFREVLREHSARKREEEAVLEATAARRNQFFAPLVDRNMQPPLAGSKYFQDQKNYRIVLAREEIQAGVRIVARRIENWCKGERIVLVGILKGAFVFLADLCRWMVRPYSVYFVEASSYKNDRVSKDGVEIVAGIPSSKFCDQLEGSAHKIVLLDELLDSGHTMQEMKQHFLSALSTTHTENDVLTACLFSKKRQQGQLQCDIVGIPDLPDLWLVGYGLDDRGTKRGWTELFAMPKVKIVEVIDKAEVDKLLEILDDAAVLTAPTRFARFELTHHPRKQRYRVAGLDTSGDALDAGSKLHMSKGTDIKKANIEEALSKLTIVKGKFEHELKFAFIQENVHLIPEDEIFSGNTQVYGEMRCKLRREIARTADRVGVEGPSELVIPTVTGQP